MISAIIKKLTKKTVVIVSSILVGVILVAGLIILFSTGTSKTDAAFDYQATAQEYGVSENVAYLIRLTQQYDENVDVEMLAGMSITEIVDNLRNEYINVFNYKKIAQEYGVSQDAAYLANKIAMLDSNEDIELLVNLPITQLVDTLREKLLQPQTQVADEADSQGTEVAYVDEAEVAFADEPIEDVDTEDANDEPVEDVDTEATNDEPVENVDTDNNDTDTQDSDSDSGNTSSEEPKPTQKPEEKPQKEWSEWSGWMSVDEAENIVYNQGDSYREFELDIKQQWRTATEEYREKWRYKKVEDSDWSEWAWGYPPSEIEDGWGTIYDVEVINELDPDASTFGEWQDDSSKVKYIYSNKYQIRVVARYRFFG